MATGNPRLTTCPDCGHTVSRRADSCPSCGAPLKPSAHTNSPAAIGTGTRSTPPTAAPEWMKPLGYVVFVIGMLAFVASFWVDLQSSPHHKHDDLDQWLISAFVGLFNPLFFVGVPLGLYWLSRCGELKRLLGGPNQPSKPLLKPTTPKPRRPVSKSTLRLHATFAWFVLCVVVFLLVIIVGLFVCDLLDEPRPFKDAGSPSPLDYDTREADNAGVAAKTELIAASPASDDTTSDLLRDFTFAESEVPQVPGEPDMTGVLETGAESTQTPETEPGAIQPHATGSITDLRASSAYDIWCEGTFARNVEGIAGWMKIYRPRLAPEVGKREVGKIRVFRTKGNQAIGSCDGFLPRVGDVVELYRRDPDLFESDVTFE